MTSNFTYSEKLIYQLSDSGWFANPAGIEGHEVIVLEQVASQGTRYYATLRPGGTLRLGDRIFGRYKAYAVDMRSGRSFGVEREFATVEGNRTVKLKANVRYHVLDSKRVALYSADPLGELRDKVIATLARELARWPQKGVTHQVCEDIIRSIGYVESLGLNVDGADVLEFGGDQTVAGRHAEVEQVEHELDVRRRRELADIETAERKARAELQLNQERIDGIDLRNPNALMHMYPDTINAILQMLSQQQVAALNSQTASQDAARKLIAEAIGGYMRQQHEAEQLDPNAIAEMVRKQLLSPGVGGGAPGIGQITFGDAGAPGLLPGRIDFGEGAASGTSESKLDKRIQFGDDQ